VINHLNSSFGIDASKEVSKAEKMGPKSSKINVLFHHSETAMDLLKTVKKLNKSGLL
jgi:hypothetical protein